MNLWCQRSLLSLRKHYEMGPENQVIILNVLQELQRDIEKHSTGVASVLNLCEVLLHDCDACSTETECDSIQQATRGLDRRWRNICAMSMERRLKSVHLLPNLQQDSALVLKFKQILNQLQNHDNLLSPLIQVIQ